MKSGGKNQRFSLTLLAAMVVFVIQVLSVIVSALTMFLLIKTGVLADIDQSSQTHWRIVSTMAIISTVFGVIITAVGSMLYLRPINRIISQMNRLASGDYRARLHFGRPISAYPTFREISTSFNKMAEELESTEMLRSDFINNFSHEFKTPIVSISGFAKLLKRGDLTAQQQREYLDIIESESVRLAAMATNVLDMTKVENQTILTDVTRFNLSEQIRSCVLLLLEGKWAQKEIEFSVEFDEYAIMANEEMLKHVWLNILDNAIKFSPEGAVVSVAIQDRGQRLDVTVCNSGECIPQDRIGKIFNKFYQADESHSKEGNGIGLALVKMITELHRGTVTVTSENDLTAFTVSLPKDCGY